MRSKELSCSFFFHSSIFSSISIHSATNVITCATLRLKQMWRLTKAKTEMKHEHWTKKLNWSSYKKLALRASWTHGLIAQPVRASERNSVIVGSISTEAHYIYIYVCVCVCVCVCLCVCVNFLKFCRKFLKIWNYNILSLLSEVYSGIQNPIKHLRWSFYWKSLKNCFRKKIHLRCLTGFIIVTILCYNCQRVTLMVC